jgi:hypothetical protein
MTGNGISMRTIKNHLRHYTYKDDIKQTKMTGAEEEKMA